MQRHLFTNQFKDQTVKDLSGFTKSVQSVACCLADYLPNPFPSYKKIMDDLGIGSENTVSKAIKFLKAYNFINIQKMVGNKNKYVLNVLTPAQIESAVQLSNNTNKSAVLKVQCSAESAVQKCSSETALTAVSTSIEALPVLNTALLSNSQSAVQCDKKNLQNSETALLSSETAVSAVQYCSECSVSNNISNNNISNNIFTPIANVTPVDIYKSYTAFSEIASEKVQCSAESAVQKCSAVVETPTKQKQAFFGNGAPVPKRIPLPNETPEMTAYYDAQHQKRLNANQASNTPMTKPDTQTIEHKPEHDVLKNLLHILNLQNEKIDALTSKIENLEKTAAENKQDTLQAIANLEEVARNVGKQLKINNENEKATKASVDSVLDQNHQIARKLQQVVNLAPQISKQQNKKTDYSNFFSSTDLAALKAAREAAGTDEEQLHEWQQSQPEVLEAIAINAKINALNQARLNK